MKRRYEETSISEEHRPSMLYTYWVTGKGRFPFDMLRYDAAWPIEHVGEMTHDGERSVKLRSYKKPTVERWLSFWWSVHP